MLAILLRMSLRLAACFSQRQAMTVCLWLARLWPRTETHAVVTANLRHCFPDWPQEKVDSVTRERLAQVPLLFFEFGQLLYWPPERILGQIYAVHGETLLQDAFADKGSGTLVLVPHFGNWEFLCAFLGHNYSLAALYDPPKQTAFEPVILSARQRYSGKMFAIDVGGMRGIVRELKRGGLVCVLPDQVPDRDAGVYADFFGQQALTMTLTHRLQDRTGARVILGSVLRREQGDYELFFEALELGADAGESATRINQAIEGVVLRAPAQYQWDYKRFKRPLEHVAPGVRNIYRRQ